MSETNNPFTQSQLNTLYSLVNNYIKSGEVEDGDQGYYLDLRDTILSLGE